MRMLPWVFCFWSILWAGTVEATTYYVSTSGNDATGNGSVANPWRWPKRCLTAGVFVSGDTCHVMAGTYTGTDAVWREPDASVPNGTSGNYTTLEGEGIGVTILRPTANGSNINDPAWLQFKQLTIDHINIAATDHSCIRGAKSAVGGGNLVFEDLECLNAGAAASCCFAGGLFVASPDTSINNIRVTRVHSHHNGLVGGHGIYFIASNVVIEDSEFNDNAHCGIQDRSNTGIPTTNVVIRRNDIHDNQTAGGQTGGICLIANDSQVYNNLIYNNPGVGIYATSDAVSPTNHYYNNILYNNGLGMQCGIFAPVVSTCVLTNSIIIGNSGGDLITYSGWSITGSHNACVSAETDCPTTGRVLITTILSCTISTTDFHLQPLGNPCVNAGTTIADLTQDIEGTPRPQGAAYDIGPYELGTGDITPPTAPSGLRIS